MQREKRRRKKGERRKKSERKRRSAGLCPGSFPPFCGCFYLFSVAACVAQWLTNMCPSRRKPPASESLQTNTQTHIVDSSIFLSLAFLSHPSHPLHFISMADSLCKAVGLQYFHDVSQTHLGLNILFTSSQHSENHNITELRQKFRTHYSLFRSRPRSKSSPSALLSYIVF